MKLLTLVSLKLYKFIKNVAHANIQIISLKSLLIQKKFSKIKSPILKILNYFYRWVIDGFL